MRVNDIITIREMAGEDCPIISEAFEAQGWEKLVSQYRGYWQESLEGKRDVLLAEVNGQFAGYLTIVWDSRYQPFRQQEIPEIVDFNVLIKYRRKRVGTSLMDEAEKRIAARSATAGLAVCLHADYGPAQVLYIKRGYVPDGKGVYYQGVYPPGGTQVMLDDDLCLLLTKRLDMGIKE